MRAQRASKNRPTGSAYVRGPAQRSLLRLAIHPHASFDAINDGAGRQEIDDISTVAIRCLWLRGPVLQTGEPIAGCFYVLRQGVDDRSSMECAREAFSRHDPPRLPCVHASWHSGDDAGPEERVIVHVVRQAAIAAREAEAQAHHEERAHPTVVRRPARRPIARQVNAVGAHPSLSRHGGS